MTGQYTKIAGTARHHDHIDLFRGQQTDRRYQFKGDFIFRAVGHIEFLAEIP